MAESIVNTVLTVIISALIGGAITYVTAVRKLTNRVEDLEKWRRFVQEDTNNSAEERKILLSSVLACLKGLKEQGCNKPPVITAIADLERYLCDQAHRVRSYTNKSGDNDD